MAAAVSASLLAALETPRAFAQACQPVVTVPTGFQEYYVLGRESHVYNMMNRVATGEAAGLTSNATSSVVSAVTSANGQIIYYDQWEDGLDAGLNSSFATFPNPQQASTLIFGDGNPANGDACVYASGCAGDVMNPGTALTLASNGGVTGICTPPATGAGTLGCSVPLPRNALAVRFDGGDRVVSSGGPVSLIHNQDPLATIIGGAVEVLSRQAYAGATSYSIPAGENLYLGQNTVTEIFQYVDIDIVAYQDNTQVTITSPGPTGGTVSFTLNQGQHYTNRNCVTAPASSACANGLIDDTTLAPFIRINSGTKISTTGPLAGMIHSGGDDTYSTDIFPILPDLLHGNDYLIPSAGDNAGVNGNRPMNLYIFNPDPVNTITVTATDSVGSRDFTVGPNATVNYFDGAPGPPTVPVANRFVPFDSTVRLTSTNNFWGLTAHDHQTVIADWGYAWLATKFLATSYTVGYAPGTRAAFPSCGPAPCNTANRAPVWVGATDDNTLVRIDLNNDGVFDLVDTNGDDLADNGDLADPSCATPATLCVYRVNAPNSLGNRMTLRVFDQTDYDNTGTVIFATKPVAVVYGQDTDQGVSGDQTPDTGYTIFPSLQNFLDPVLTIDKSVSPLSISASAGGTVTFTLTTSSYSYGLDPLNVFDDLPPGLSCAGLAGNYVTNSSRITYPDLSQQVGDAATSASCSVGGGAFGRDRLSWTLSPDSIAANQNLTVEFQVNIPGGGSGCLFNDATGQGTLGTSTFETSDQVAIIRTDVGLTKSVVHDGSPEPGETLTYTVVVTNNGNAAETNARLSDPLPGGTTFAAGSILNTPPFVGSYNAGQNAVVWTAASVPPPAGVSSLSRSGGTATATATAHGFSNGDSVLIAGASPAAYNGTFGVTVLDPNTFTYALAGGPDAASGTITASKRYVLSFGATISAGAAAGTVISNVAQYESDQITAIPSPTVDVTLVGPVLSRVKTVTPNPLHPNEIATFEITVSNSGAGSATNLVVTDPLAGSNTTYLAGSLQRSLNGGPFASLTDAADGDGGTLSGTTITFALASLPAGQDVRFRFQSTVNAGTGGLVVANQASVASTQTGSGDTNLVQVPIIGNATVTGHVFLDSNGDGVQNGGEPNLAGVTVFVTDSTGAVQTEVTDAAGNYSVVVPAGATTLDVDQTDSDIPNNSTLTTGNDPQVVNAVANVTTGSGPVGFDPPPLLITKTSSAGGTAIPGQTISYTVSVRNDSGGLQSGITLNDAVPAGTSFVPGSAQLRLNAFRVTEYFLDNAGPDQCTEAGTDFAGTTCTLTLNQNLAPNYFVIIQGSDVNNGGAGGDTTPAQDSVALSDDPFSTGDFGGAVAANQIQLTRNTDATNWSGVVSVVECVAPNCATDANGFRLLSVERVNLPAGGAPGATTGTDASATAWLAGDLGRIMLVGGANGAGCNTADATVAEHQACHPRLFPSGANTINWTRDGAGQLPFASAATATVMVIQWGTAWTAQRTAILAGNNGGDGINAAGEYNTVAIAPVARANTWIWGTGHTGEDDNGGTAEGVALTLGNGVATNALESLIAAGTDAAGELINFDVYALTHPNLAVEHRFVAEAAFGNTNDVAGFTAAATNRMALVYNDLDLHDNNWPRPLLSARYLNNNTIRLERRESASSYAAWVQAINFNSVPTQLITCLPVFPAAANNCTEPATNANVVAPSGGFTLSAGHTLTFTYQVTVDTAGPNQVTNTATVTTTQEPAPRSESVTDNVVRAAVTLEPNNAGFTTPNSTLIFTHEVTNRGNLTDSFNLIVLNENNWRVDLLDPATGTVIATDSNGDGVWDSGTVNTGSLAVGASRTYWVRVTVPAGALAGAESTTLVRASSAANPAVSAEASDEITVLSSLGTVDVVPDNSGVATAGSFVAYTHRVFNNTGATDTFDLTAAGSQGWTTTLHYDSNGDGEFTDGVDIAIANTAALAPGASQVVFVRISVPAGTSAGTTDVTILTATSRNDTNLYDSASDTTTVSAPTALDLSGGGTRMVVPGDLAVFPGTLYNLGSNASDFEFTIGPSSLQGGDALNHPTDLWIDSNGDGVFEFAARDDDGDGDWDSFGPGFNDDGDAFPDVDLLAGATMAYELRKPIDAAQQLPQEFVTLTARAGLAGTGEGDSVTAQWLIAAVTRASIRGLRVDPAGVVEFATGMQRRTKSFNLYEVSDKAGSEPVLLNDAPVLSPLADSVTPILYRVQTRPLTKGFLLIEELETTGKRLLKGPYSISDARLRQGLERIEARLDRAGTPRSSVRKARLLSQRPKPAKVRSQRPRRSAAREGVRIEIADAGLVEIARPELEAAGLPASAGERTLRLTNLERAVPFTLERDAAGGETLRFSAEELATDHTGSNVYLLTWGKKPFPMEVALTRSAEPRLPGFVRIEKTMVYLADAPANADPFLWDVLYSDGNAWPYADWDPTGESGRFDLPGLATGAAGPVRVRVRLAGYNDLRHTVEARINGTSVREPFRFDGATGTTLEGSIAAELLQATGNVLTLVYSATTKDGDPTADGYVYLDFVEIAAPVAQTASAAEVLSLSAYDPSLAAFRNVQYLVVTHPDFREAADRIAALKQAEGLKAAVVETDNAYDRWSGGIVESRAIQALIRQAASQSGRLKYVLLVGDDTFDPQNFGYAQGYVDAEQRVYVPSMLSRDSGFGRIPSENLYADLNGDGSPELAIGRLPVQSADEADAMAEKIANQTALLQAQAGRQLFVADVPRADDAPFRAEADEVAAIIGAAPEQNLFVDASQGAEEARAALLSGWQAGAAATHYFGHGGPFLWSDLSLLTVDDVAEQGHTLAPTLLMMWTCDAQWYLNLGPSLGEALFLVPNGGAVASFGPSGIVAPAKHRELYERVYGGLGSGQTLGETLRRAKADALAAKASNREVIDGFNLLGDPALRLPAQP